MTTKIKILINISDISIITGDNPYKSKRDYLIENRNFQVKYLFIKIINYQNFCKYFYFT